MQSNIFAKQKEYASEMRRELTEDQRQYHEEYFNKYNDYLLLLSKHREPAVIEGWSTLHRSFPTSS